LTFVSEQYVITDTEVLAAVDRRRSRIHVIAARPQKKQSVNITGCCSQVAATGKLLPLLLAVE